MAFVSGVYTQEVLVPCRISPFYKALYECTNAKAVSVSCNRVCNYQEPTCPPPPECPTCPPPPEVPKCPEIPFEATIITSGDLLYGQIGKKIQTYKLVKGRHQNPFQLNLTDTAAFLLFPGYPLLEYYPVQVQDPLQPAQSSQELLRDLESAISYRVL